MNFNSTTARRAGSTAAIAVVMLAACSTGAVDGQPEVAVTEAPGESPTPTLAVAEFEDDAAAPSAEDPDPAALPDDLVEGEAVDDSFDPTVAPEDLTEQIEAPAPNPEPIVDLAPDPASAAPYDGVELTLHQCCDTTPAFADLRGAPVDTVVVDDGVFFGSWSLEVPASDAVSSWSIALTLPDESFAFSTNNEQFTLTCTAGACATAFGNETAALITDRRYQAVIADFGADELPSGTYEVRLASQPGDILEVTP